MLEVSLKKNLYETSLMKFSFSLHFQTTSSKSTYHMYLVCISWLIGIQCSLQDASSVYILYKDAGTWKSFSNSKTFHCVIIYVIRAHVLKEFCIGKGWYIEKRSINTKRAAITLFLSKMITKGKPIWWSKWLFYRIFFFFPLYGFG